MVDLTDDDFGFVVAIKLNLPMDIVKSLCLETFQTARYHGFHHVVLVIVPFRVGVWTWDPQRFFPTSVSMILFQEWEQTWKDLLHPVGSVQMRNQLLQTDPKSSNFLCSSVQLREKWEPWFSGAIFSLHITDTFLCCLSREFPFCDRRIFPG